MFGTMARMATQGEKPTGEGALTRLITDAAAGDSRATDALLEAVYDELRKLAAARLAREKPGQTIQATALVHEAYLRLVAGDGTNEWDGRPHFFSAAAEAMRRILVEQARRKAAAKRGAGRAPLPLDESVPVETDDSIRTLALDEALSRFETVDPSKAALVKLRYFAGVSEQQAADLLGISRATAARYWAYARAWLCDEILRLQRGES